MTKSSIWQLPFTTLPAWRRRHVHKSKHVVEKLFNMKGAAVIDGYFNHICVTFWLPVFTPSHGQVYIKSNYPHFNPFPHHSHLPVAYGHYVPAIGLELKSTDRQKRWKDWQLKSADRNSVLIDNVCSLYPRNPIANSFIGMRRNMLNGADGTVMLIQAS